MGAQAAGDVLREQGACWHCPAEVLGSPAQRFCQGLGMTAPLPLQSSGLLHRSWSPCVNPPHELPCSMGAHVHGLDTMPTVTLGPACD